MKKVIIAVLAVAIAAFVAYSSHRVYQDYQLANSPNYRVLIAYNKAYLKNFGYVLEAYKSVLTEEGIAWETVEAHQLMSFNAGKTAQNSPAIIFPDGLLQSMPDETIGWIKGYLNHGGNLAVIYDAGVKTPKGFFRDQAQLANLTGLNYITFSKLKENAYTFGYLQFASQAQADILQIPPGKMDKDLFLSGYLYGKLRYPAARNDQTGSLSDDNILASVITENGEKYPAVTLRKFGQGQVLYVNLPLGHLKAHSDDLPLRAIMRSFLFHTVKMPHLVNVEKGKGGLVINWHIDANAEWPAVYQAIEHEILDKDLRYSIHITAGDFRDREGDGLGFEACGKGKSFAQLLLPFGQIGSHGGWAHNWFAENIEKGDFAKKDIALYISKNNDCLQSITNYPIKEYSAPVGVHPQPLKTEILESMGFNSYYYTGDNGSAPNRSFYGGVMVSSSVIAFPMLSYDKSASLYEMKEHGFTEEEVQRWLFDSVDYVIKNRTTRLFYSHLHDITSYPQAIHNFLQYAKLKQSEGILQIEPMSTFARYLQNFVKTEFSFRNQEKGMVIHLKNTNGLKGITVAVPRQTYRLKTQINIASAEDENYYYLTVNEDVREKTILVDGI